MPSRAANASVVGLRLSRGCHGVGGWRPARLERHGERLAEHEHERAGEHQQSDRDDAADSPARGAGASVATHAARRYLVTLGARRLRLVAWIALVAVLVGVFSTWTKDGSVTLNGIQGPNDGWLILLLVVPLLLWARMAERGSWTGVVGMLGASLVMCWTALEDWLDGRDALGASVGYGLLLVVSGSIVLAVAAVVRAVDLARVVRRREEAGPS